LVTLALSVASCNSKGTGDSGAKCQPTANAGPDQIVALGSTVSLPGPATPTAESKVCDPTDQLGYTWSFVQVPPGSALTDADFGATNGTSAATDTFVPDVVGSYVVSLVLTEASISSPADLAVITVGSDNLPPIADAGPDETGTVGARAVVDGSASSDPEGQPLTYQWTLASEPTDSKLGSTDLFDATSVTASLVPDVSGTYTLSLVVSDGVNYSHNLTLIRALPERARLHTSQEWRGENAAALSPAQIDVYGFTVTVVDVFDAGVAKPEG
jgi:hypothetical protein